MCKTIKLIIQAALLVVLASSVWSNAIAQPAEEQDPNLSSPGGTQVVDDEITLEWSYMPYQYGLYSNGYFVTANPFVPYVDLYRPPSSGKIRDLAKSRQRCDYLGFIESMGSLMRCNGNPGENPGVYSYNGRAHSLVKRYANLEDMPTEVISSLRNKRYLYVSQKDKTNPVGSMSANANAALATHYIVKAQESDPNFPPGASGDSFKPNGLPLQWTLTATQPVVAFVTREAANPNEVYLGKVEGLYLGFNKQGSWVASASTGKVFIWNFANQALVVGANSWWGAPLDLSNPSPLMQALIYYDQHSHTGGSDPGQTEDPNFPPTLAYNRRPEVPVSWTLNNPPDSRDLSSTNSVFNNAWYLGFNERGSWLMAGVENKIYIWSFKTMSISEAAIQLENVPTNVLRTLRNKSSMTEVTIANLTGHGRSGVTSVDTKGKSTPYIPPTVAGDGNAQYASGKAGTNSAGVGTTPQATGFAAMGTSQKINGSGARLVGSTLTFTLDNGSTVSYKVTRSNNSMMANPNAPKSNDPNDVAGQWAAEDPKIKDKFTLLFVDGRTGKVSGQEFVGPVAQAMKKMSGASLGP